MTASVSAAEADLDAEGCDDPATESVCILGYN